MFCALAHFVTGLRTLLSGVLIVNRSPYHLQIAQPPGCYVLFVVYAPMGYSQLIAALALRVQQLSHSGTGHLWSG